MDDVGRLCLIAVERSLRLETLLCRQPGICEPGLILSFEGCSEPNSGLNSDRAQTEKPLIMKRSRVASRLAFGRRESVRVGQSARSVDDDRLVLGQCPNELEASFYA